MPVLDVGRRVLAAAGVVFLEALAAPAGPHAPRLRVNQLTLLVAVPRRSRARLEVPPTATDVLRVHRRDDPSEVRIAAGRRRLLRLSDRHRQQTAADNQRRYGDAHMSPLPTPHSPLPTI